MGFLDLGKYMYCSTALLELEGLVYRKEEGVPCRIRVGPRRFLNVHMRPEEIKLLLWRKENGTVTYHRALEVPVKKKEDGSLEIDAVALVKQYVGSDIRFCDTERWRRVKNRGWSDTFLATDVGAATSRTVWLDIDSIHSSLFFAPGGLSLCGQEVTSIYWNTFYSHCSAHGEKLRPLVERALGTGHTLNGEELRECLERIPDLWLNSLCIRTRQGSYEVSRSMQEGISVELADGTQISDYKPGKACQGVGMVETLLRLMREEDEAGVRAALEELAERKLVTPKKKKK